MIQTTELLHIDSPRDVGVRKLSDDIIVHGKDELVEYDPNLKSFQASYREGTHC